MTIRIIGSSLPDGEPFDLKVVDGKWVDENTLDLDFTINGWVLPGLVDVHTHPGAVKAGDPLSPELLRTQLKEQVQHGVLAIRSPGLAGNPPDWFAKDSEIPVAFHAGPWLAKPGQFISGWGKRVSDRDFPKVAAAQASESGWCKIIADWGIEDAPVSQSVMREIVAAVHDVGGRVAVHSQNAGGGRAAVLAGVDSLEHGMWLDEDLLDLMATNGTALTPTLNVFQISVDRFREKPAGRKRDWYVQGTERHPHLIQSAAEAGVLILAGTDSFDFRIGEEIRALAGAGMDPEAAIATASWRARDFLRLPTFQPGTFADAIIYEEDPRKNLDILDYPAWVIRAGRLVKSPA